MRLWWFPVLFFLTIITAGLRSPAATNLEILHERLLRIIEEDAVVPEGNPERWTETIGPDGRWRDINYRDAAATLWEPRKHWRRIRHLAILERRQPGGATVSGVNRLDVIKAAVHSWIEDTPQCSNAWYNAISLPTEIAYTLIAVGGELEPHTRKALLQLINHPPGRFPVGVNDGDYRFDAGIRATGQNLAWLAWLHLLMGVIDHREEWIRKGAETLFSTLHQTTGEGLQHDSSFHQHGSQYYSGGYGIHFTETIGNALFVLHGSPYAPSDDMEALFVDFLLQGQRWITRGRTLNFLSLGRRIAVPDQNAESIGRIAGRLADAGLQPEKPLRALATSIQDDTPMITLDAIRMFYRSDVMVQHRPDFSFALRATSFRLRGGESGNGENLLGYYLGFGTYSLQLRGDEYSGLFPLWNWRRLPGSLIPENAELPVDSYGWNSAGRTAFAGGAFLRNSSAFGYDYEWQGTAARRAWFTSSEGVLAMAAAVKDRDDRPLRQTLNQCLARGSVEILGAGEQMQTTESLQYVDIAQAVAHDGVHYLFPSPREVSLLREERRGSWEKINKNLREEDNLAEDIFELSFPLTEEDHKGYHYWMLLERKTSLSESLRKAQAWEILRNDRDCQAVYDREHDRILFIGYHPTLLVFPEKLIMRTFHPCALVFSFEEDRIELVAADPTKSLFHLRLAIFKRLLTGNFAEPLPKYSFTLMAIDLPQGPYRGKATGPILLKPVDSSN